MYEDFTRQELIKEIKNLKIENRELIELYQYASSQYLETGLKFVDKLVETEKYQEELRNLKFSLCQPFDVKKELDKIKQELRELEKRDEQ